MAKNVPKCVSLDHFSACCELSIEYFIYPAGYTAHENMYVLREHQNLTTKQLLPVLVYLLAKMQSLP